MLREPFRGSCRDGEGKGEWLWPSVPWTKVRQRKVALWDDGVAFLCGSDMEGLSDMVALSQESERQTERGRGRERAMVEEGTQGRGSQAGGTEARAHGARRG